MLFHALVGAIFVQYDLDTVYQWLEITFRTLVISANMDFTKRFGHGDGGHDFEPLRNAGFDQPRRLDETIKADACLFTLAFIQTYAFEIGQEGKPATDLLKNNNIGFEFWKEDLVGDSQRHSEIGDHLLALWVSEICVKKYPQDRTTNQNKKPSVLLGVSNIIHTLLSPGHSFCRSIGRPCGYDRHVCPCNAGESFGCRESQC